MKRIRIHNDIDFQWSIFDGAGNPYELEGLDLRLWMRSATLEIEVKTFTIEHNIIRWTFWGKDQSREGVYDVILCQNCGNLGMLTLDECDAIMLVSHTCQSGDDGIPSSIHAESVDLVSNVDSLWGIIHEVRINLWVKNGANMLRDGTSADIEAEVTLGDKNITGLIPQNYYSWKRSSKNEPADELWNLQHIGVGNEIHVEQIDVNRDCTFYCVIPPECLRDINV